MQGIFNTALHLLNPADEVIVIDPGYDYYSQIRLFGGVPVRVAAHEKNRFKVDPDDIQKAITEKTKLMFINTPSNPTGAVLDQKILQAIANLARQHNIVVLSDEPYESIIFAGVYVLCLSEHIRFRPYILGTGKIPRKRTSGCRGTR
jgi:aspartate/methionine/tyrosine aminotransferase